MKRGAVRIEEWLNTFRTGTCITSGKTDAPFIKNYNLTKSKSFKR